MKITMKIKIKILKMKKLIIAKAKKVAQIKEMNPKF